MFKLLAITTAIAILTTGCASTTQTSAFSNNRATQESERSYEACAVVRLHKDMFQPQILDNLVTSGRLNTEQAQRAAQSNVKIGDPECVAYAAFGLFRHQVGATRNTAGQVTETHASYLCTNSNAPCPGVFLRFTDGKVSSIEEIKNIK